MKKMMITLLTPLLLSLMFASCSEQPEQLSEADKAIITKTETDLVLEWNKTKDYATYVKGLYAEDATVLLPNIEAVKGQDAIIKELSKMGTDASLTIAINDINGEENIAYVYGNYDMQVKGMKDHGKYIEVWKKQKDGTWKIIYDIFNSSVPMVMDTTKK